MKTYSSENRFFFLVILIQTSGCYPFILQMMRSIASMQLAGFHLWIFFSRVYVENYMFLLHFENSQINDNVYPNQQQNYFTICDPSRENIPKVSKFSFVKKKLSWKYASFPCLDGLIALKFGGFIARLSRNPPAKFGCRSLSGAEVSGCDLRN